MEPTSLSIKKTSKRKRIMIILSVFILVLAILVIICSLFLASFIMTGKRQSLSEAFAWQSQHYDTSFYSGLEKEDYQVKGYEGYELHVELLKNSQPTGKYVILSHGYTDNRMGALKYVPMYLDLGFSCIIYDLRGHGENEETFTTYGIREGKDLEALILDTRNRYEGITQLGLHGESLGAATTLTALKSHPQADFVVADCGFSDIENVLREGYKNAHVPTFLVDLADLGARLRYHYALKKMRPIDSLEENTIPILFIHGALDGFILPKNSQDMCQKTKGYAELHLMEGADHAQSILVSPDLYKSYLSEFLKAHVSES